MERKIIYLDDAIDALRYAQHRFTVADEAGGMGTVKWSEDVIYFATAERVLAELPSAQPQPCQNHTQKAPESDTFGVKTGETCSDTISRKAAIDALEIEKTYSAVYKYGYTQTDYFKQYNTGLTDGIKALNKLPSAQPERTCVNCGRTANNGGWYADGGTRCPIEEHYALPKDGYCHLWEKRNVTDDDYPERREDERHES